MSFRQFVESGKLHWFAIGLLVGGLGLAIPVAIAFMIILVIEYREFFGYR